MRLPKYSTTTRNSQQRIVNSCPNEYEFTTESGEERIAPCRRWNCRCLDCREKHSHKLWLLAQAAHNISPFTHKVSIFPPSDLGDTARAKWVRGVFKSLKQWCIRNEVKVPDIYLTPDKHGKRKLHFNGFFRGTSRARKHLREIVRKQKREVKGNVTMPLWRDFYRQSAYQVGRRQQHLMQVPALDGRSAFIMLGNPFCWGKAALWDALQLIKGREHREGKSAGKGKKVK